MEEKLDKYVYIKSVVDDNNNILGYESANKNDFLYFVIENKKYLYCKSEVHRIEKKSLKENRDILKIFLNMLLGEDKCK